MPLPTVNSGESETDFIERCMSSEAAHEFTDHDQRVAVCISQWRAAHKDATPDLTAKLIDEDLGIIEGLGIPFGGPRGGKDLDNEYFDKDTNFAFEWFPNEGRPVLYEHGADQGPRFEVIGRQLSKRVDPQLGIWVKLQIDKAHRYSRAVLEMAKAGMLGLSSGSMGHLVRKGQEGKIVDWPWIEESLTPRPANPYALIPAEAVRHVKSVGLELPDTALPAEGPDLAAVFQRHDANQAKLAEIEAALAQARNGG